MKACLDVGYRTGQTIAACVLFRSWTDERCAGEIVERTGGAEAYAPGQFYRRELPALLAILKKVPEPLAAIIIDGYVWLREERAPGLGAHLYAALGNATPVIGVAKSHFHGTAAAEVMRGKGRRPLYITAAGMSADTAVGHIRSMHGDFRIPTLLKRADWLSRQE